MASQFGPYKLIRQVAVGGMAEIHLAKTAGIAGFEKYVAIKMIHPNFAEDEQFIQMLVDEAKIAVQLTHGNIAQTFDLGRVGDTYYITMEYVDGADLYKILRRASEQDLEMPLDVCAFVAKEISSALDHAHRKRDHTGKSLGIVHRDVSPQNVLVSYSGEVKLVDFGIAKATMKARQTAVGVIKGKYYYMSPEQAWGDPIDHRSDIFSAGIVLYEMLTGQMLYLEEDLHKLLEMARAADIAPPSKLRKGVPPQLERIVMHALAKQPGDRYQSAGDLATDLERFLHAYSPVFTASKLSSLLRQVVGDPLQVPDEAPFEHIEFRDGVMSTHPLDDSEVAHAIDRDELRDENSVIFRVADLEDAPAPAPPPVAARPAPPRAPAPPPPRVPGSPPPRPGTPMPMPAVRPPSSSGPSAAPARPASAAPSGRHPQPTPPEAAVDARNARPTTPSKPIKQIAPRVTRATDALPAVAPRPAAAGKIPSIAPRPTGGMKIPQVTKPRQPHEETRQLEQRAPANPAHDDSGLLTTDGQKLWSDVGGGGDTSDEDLDNIGERTMVTGMPGGAGSTASAGGFGGFMTDVAGDDGDGPVEATLITMVPGFGGAPADDGDASAAGDDIEDASEPDDVDDDMPTLSGREGLAMIRDMPPPRDPGRDVARPAVRKAKAPPPAALAAKIHAPAISELRKPRASRRTPPGGSPVAPNVLQAIVSSQPHEPMPAPRPQPQHAHSHPEAPHAQALPPQPPGPAYPPQGYAQPGPPGHDPYAQFPAGTPGGQPAYAGQPSGYYADASGMPLGLSPPGQQAPGVPNHLQPYLHVQGMPPGGYDPRTGQYHQMSPQGYPQVSPQALYQFQPSPQPMSLTGQMRLFEVDEMPSQYKLGSAGRRWFTYAVSGLLAISAAAAVTFLIIRSTRDAAPTVGSVRIDSMPQGAEVLFDGSRLTEKTPVTIDNTPVGTRHTIRLELAHRQPYEEIIDIPKKGGEVTVSGRLEAITGKLLVNSVPPGAEIWVNGVLRNRAPTTIGDLDILSKVHVELRLKDYQPYIHDYDWPADGKIGIDVKLAK